jgi:hypothetical protein
MPNPIVCADNGNDVAVNFRSSRYFLAHTVGVCWHCNALTSLFALALPPGHEALDLDDDAPIGETPEDTWNVASHGAFLFYVEYLPDGVRRRVNGFAPSYRLGRSDAVEGFHWANHCERCDSLLDDHELFCEPEGAFLPTSEASAGLIHLLAVDEGFEAAVAGYAYEPQFFDAMSKG